MNKLDPFLKPRLWVKHSMERYLKHSMYPWGYVYTLKDLEGNVVMTARRYVRAQRVETRELY